MIKPNQQCKNKVKQGMCWKHQSNPSNSVPNPSNSGADHFDCAICLESCPIFSTRTVELQPCLHRFHSNCLEGLNQMACPMCRATPTNLPSNIRTRIQQNVNRQRTQQNEEFLGQLFRILNLGPEDRTGRVSIGNMLRQDGEQYYIRVVAGGRNFRLNLIPE